ncbi:MAG TPA: ABC transporter substrate-binding protein, partial [Anaeromyxobacteraceae bacterium]|nr:ABC transporter substrate-binding protein [Anaeromyxobacteraceae bacterium]
MPKRTVAGIFVAVAAAVAGAVVWWPASRASGRPHRLVVASVRQPATGLLAFAGSSGCIGEQRLELQEQEFALGRDALVLLRDRRADVAVAYEIPVLRAAFEDPRLRVLSELHRSAENTRVVARRDRGVSSVEDLRGRRVGAAAGTNAEFFLDALLRFGGLREADVERVNREPPAAVDALLAGQLDAAALSDPFAHHAEVALGARAVVLKTDLYLETSLLVTRDDVVAERRPALEALARALACAERRARERPDEVLAAMRARFPAEGDLARQLARVRWRIGLDHVLLDLLRREREWLDRRGTAGMPPDLARLVEPAVL